MPVRRNRYLPRPLTAILVIFCAVLVVDISIFYTLPLRLLYPVTFDDNPGQVERAAILFNGFNHNFTGINNETKRRIHHGMSLLENNRVKQLIVVGGNREKVHRSGAKLMADYLIEQGVPAEIIRIEAKSKDTISNMEQLEKIVTKQNINTLVLISSPYHLLRLRAMHIPSQTDLRYSSYNPENSVPIPSRSEVWYSAHYNAMAYGAQVILPQAFYKKLVMWVREHTEW